jgi:uncharacterized protein YndB with AHSA1/START domain
MDTKVAAQQLVAKAEMLIRRPVSEVFEAFVDPAITSKFWFTGGSDKLAPGRRVRWDWKMYGFSVQADVKAFEENRRIVVDWSTGDEAPTTIEWRFTSRPDGTTFVSITNGGFAGTTEEIAKQAINSAEGFAFVLAGAKAYLEHGISLDLVRDRHPDGLPGG